MIAYGRTEGVNIIEDEPGKSVWIPSAHYFQPEASAAINSAYQALTIASDFVAWWFAPDVQD